MRDERTSRVDFRKALSELSWLLVYEATRDLPHKTFQVQTPLAPATGTRIDPVPLIVPVLRAGLGMLDAAFTMLPSAEIGFVGLRRNEESLDSEEYMTTVPDDLDGRPVIILDPMLATGGSLVHTAEIVERSNPGAIIVVCVLAAPEGIAHFSERYPDAQIVTASIAHFSERYPDAQIVTASIDERLNDVGFIVPGLGDAGDRQYGVQ